MLIASVKVGLRKPLLQLWVLGVLDAWSSITLGQTQASGDAALAASGAGLTGKESSETEIGDTSDALPGVHRVGVAGLEGPRASTSFNLLYGFTEPQNGSSDSHQRLGGSLAAAIAPWSFVALGLKADFRHDIHGSDIDGKDSGSVVDLTPHLRLGGVVGEGFHLGAEGRVKLPGATVGESGGPDPEVDARALFAYSALPTWVFALHAGYKFGHDGRILTEAESMRAGDRVALGLSEFDAIVLGIGMVKAVGKSELLGEVTSEMLLGSGAPDFLKSPLRAAAGIRHPLVRNLWLSAVIEAALAGRPPSLPSDPLAPVEPRVQALVGITWRFLSPKEPIAVAALEPQEETKDEPTETKAEPVDPGPPPIITSSIRVTVVDYKNHPISDAEVTIDLPEAKQEEGSSRRVPLDDRNVYVIGEIPIGEVEVTVKAELLKAQTQTVALKEGEPTDLEFKLEKADNVGSQLRGLVRSYSGEGVNASVRVEPGEQTATCDTDGSFELDLPPGVYQVIIEAEGYRSQRRTLRVRKEGVTVLNADLQKNTD